MMIAPVAPPDIVSAPPSSGRAAGGRGEFAAALAAVGRTASTTARPPAEDAARSPSDDPTSPEEPLDETTVPRDEPEPLFPDPTVVLLLSALSSGAAAEIPGSGNAAAAPLVAVASPAAGVAGASSPSAATVADLAALIQTVAGDDLVAPAALTLEPLALSDSAGPAAEIALSSPAVEADFSRFGAETDLSRPEAPAAEPLLSVGEGVRPLPLAPAAPAQGNSRPTAREIAPRQLVEQIAPRLAGRLEQTSEFRITLQPESLGTVEVAVRVSPTAIQIVLAADEKARELLSAGLAELRATLRPPDGRTLAIDIAARLSSGFDANTPFGRGSSAWSPPTPASRRERVHDEPADRALPLAQTAASGRIDYRI
ncbi:MAG: flagellar hook-length control protein FliK [Chloroflexota bacterium]|nr:flagellar hook-length control protein FliK [Dehalococcoidia bacterium]MDW8254460.1 flagellar hook-length control protein FliK [Chloroflexota bacterium]